MVRLLCYCIEQVSLLIEDDVLVTADGARVLGPAIPKTAEDVEAVACIKMPDHERGRSCSCGAQRTFGHLIEHIMRDLPFSCCFSTP